MNLLIFAGHIDYLMNEEGRILTMLTNKITETESWLKETELKSTRTIEHEYREQELIAIAERWLNYKGIETRDPYEHNLKQSWKILLDFGKYLEELHNVE